jgi:Transposase, Mutator family
VEGALPQVADASSVTTVTPLTREDGNFFPQGAERQRTRTLAVPLIGVLPAEQIRVMDNDMFGTGTLAYRPATGRQERWLPEFFRSGPPRRSSSSDFSRFDERRPALAGRHRMKIEEVVRQVLREEHGDVIRESVTAVTQELMEAEVSELIGAERGERTEDRATHRNGYRLPDCQVSLRQHAPCRALMSRSDRVASQTIQAAKHLVPDLVPESTMCSRAARPEPGYLAVRRRKRAPRRQSQVACRDAARRHR